MAVSYRLSHGEIVITRNTLLRKDLYDYAKSQYLNISQIFESLLERHYNIEHSPNPLREYNKGTLRSASTKIAKDGTEYIRVTLYINKELNDLIENDRTFHLKDKLNQWLEITFQAKDPREKFRELQAEQTKLIDVVSEYESAQASLQEEAEQRVQDYIQEQQKKSNQVRISEISKRDVIEKNIVLNQWRRKLPEKDPHCEFITTWIDFAKELSAESGHDIKPGELQKYVREAVRA